MHSPALVTQMRVNVQWVPRSRTSSSTSWRGPDWFDYVDVAELSAELSHCYRDLGKPEEAIHHATQALDYASGDYARSDFFVAMVLADAHLDRGDLEEGCRIAEKALTVGEGLDSIRCRSYVEEFKQRLSPHRKSSEVRRLVSAVHGSHLWTPSKN